ncbi:putative receptor protein kinase [Nymphaea thermarum]|nr:putative receptor protein kinase [Nymphaea thermarum]
MSTSSTEGFDMVWTVNSTGDCLRCTALGGHCGYNITGDFFICMKARNCGVTFISAQNLFDYCPETRCGNLTVKYPFYLESTVPSSSQSLCGYEGFGINCSTGNPILTLVSDVYLLKSINYNSKQLALIDTEIHFNPCPAPGHNVSVDPNSALKFDPLTNGTPVAVKLMEKSYNDGEEFCNEVATIGMIHHVIVVRLLGFCVEGSRRALVYDFMENGSLEKFTDTTVAGRCLLRERLYDIALGIARGIEYLHQGCDQRIIHFDIKPHNILLDHDYTPKISDFGLAKSCSKERSTVLQKAKTQSVTLLLRYSMAIPSMSRIKLMFIASECY